MKKRVLLLGDSIRMGYQADVKSLLEPEFDVFYDAEDNGRFAAYTLWQANQMYKHYTTLGKGQMRKNHDTS